MNAIHAMFAVTIVMPLALTLAALGYLRPILRHVLVEICGTAERAEFWIRSITILSVFGALILVLGFGPRGDGAHLLEDLRWILILTLAGAFVGIAWVARTIWNSLMNCPETRARLFPGDVDEESAAVDASATAVAPAN